MINPADTAAAFGILAGLSLLLTVPVCWFVVRTGSSRSAGNSRLKARRLNLAGSAMLALGGFLMLGGLIGQIAFALMPNASEEMFASVGTSAAGVLLALIGLVVRSCAKSLGRLIDDEDHDVQIAIDRQLGLISFIGWAGVVLILLVVATPLTLILLIVVVLALQKLRAPRQCQLLWISTLTVRSGRNLSTEIRNHASTTYGSYAVCLRQLAQEIESGSEIGVCLLEARERAQRAR